MSSEELTIKEQQFNEVMARLKSRLSLSSYNQLAASLGLSSGDFGNRKKRGSLPYEAILDLCRSRNMSVEWVLTGEFPKMDGSLKGDGSHTMGGLSIPLEDQKKAQFLVWLDAWWPLAELPQKFWFLIQMERTFPEYAQSLQDLGIETDSELPSVLIAKASCPRCGHENSFRPDGAKKIKCFGCKQPYHVGLLPEKAPNKKAK